MSRVGKKPIKISEGVKIEQTGQTIKVSGPKGEMALSIPAGIEVNISQGEVTCGLKGGSTSIWGLTRSLIANAVIGVSQGWTKTLELVGVGYRATVEGDEVVLTVGFSHPVRFKAPEGITFSVSENKIKVTGADKQLVGEVAANLRRIRPPEPYKGKGIKYEGEKIRRKIGKAAKTLGGVGGTGGKA